MANKKLQVILLEDVPKLGRKFDVEEVAMGYFRNYLLPNGLAKPATDAALKELEEKRQKIKERREKRRKEYESQAEELEGQEFSFEVNTGDEDQVYGSVSSEDIEEVLKEKGFTDVSVKLEGSIQEIGGREVEVRFGEGVSTTINVEVQPREEEESVD